MSFRVKPRFAAQTVGSVPVFGILGAEDVPVTPLAYTAEIAGAPSEALLDTLESISDTIVLREDIPVSVGHLRRRLERDQEFFLKVLHSEGYYGAAVAVEFDEAARPIPVRFVIDAGAPYLLDKVELKWTVPASAEGPGLPQVSELGLQTGAPLRAQEVLDAEARLILLVREAGFPFPQVSNRAVVVEHATARAEVTFHVDTGSRARFGEARITGLTSVDERFVRANLAWKESEWFMGSLLPKTQGTLYRTRLFSIVRIEAIQEVGETGAVPISIHLQERKHRTISAGLRFNSDTGVDVLTDWEHRNIRELGRNVTVGLGVGQTEQGLGASYAIPFFRGKEQRLILETEARRRELDAYTSQRMGGMVTLERMLAERVTGRVGIAYRFDHVEQKGDTNTYHLLSLPATVEWTTADDPLDPTEGMRATVVIEPYVDITDMGTHFLKTEAGVSQYIPIGESRDFILALRMKLGVIAGAGRDSIPPDERYYAGGGGSVRGYPFHTISPLEDDDPIGGRSLLESSIELRKKVTETVGVVVFLDGGTVSDSVYPDFDSDYYLGVGVGGRYYSPVGPLRFDIAFPLDRRSGLDSAFEIYISLGQAF